jgi:hypothetical protein
LERRLSAPTLRNGAVAVVAAFATTEVRTRKINSREFPERERSNQNGGHVTQNVPIGKDE